MGSQHFVAFLILCFFSVENVFCQNYYQVLGVKPGASQGDIKRAFRDMALKYHPDKSKQASDAETFINIRKAYEVLGNMKKRQQYDAKLKFQSATFNFDKTFFRQNSKTWTSEQKDDEPDQESFGSDFQFADIFNMVMDVIKQESASSGDKKRHDGGTTNKESDLARFIIRNLVKGFASWNTNNGEKDNPGESKSQFQDPSSQRPSLANHLFVIFRSCDFSRNTMSVLTCARDVINLFF